METENYYCLKTCLTFPRKIWKIPSAPLEMFFTFYSVRFVLVYQKALNSPDTNFKLLRKKLFKCTNEVKTRDGVLFIDLSALRSSARIYYST